MGTRSMNALVVKGDHKPTAAAAAFLNEALVVRSIDGQAYSWETNIQPLWARTSVQDLKEETAILEWLLQLPAKDFRLMRCGEELGVLGDWMEHPFRDLDGMKSVIDTYQEELAAAAAAGNVAHALSEREVLIQAIAEKIRADATCPPSKARAQYDITAEEATQEALGIVTPPKAHSYSSWRHGGWYVHTVRYPSGACGCVSRNYPDKRWRIACDTRDDAPTFKSRDDAANAEHELALQEWKKATLPA